MEDLMLGSVHKDLFSLAENYGDVSFDSERFVSELQSALGFLNHTGRGAAIPNEGSELCSSGSDDLNELSWAVNPPEHEQLYEVSQQLMESTAAPFVHIQLMFSERFTNQSQFTFCVRETN